jgi:hypothetical protein
LLAEIYRHFSLFSVGGWVWERENHSIDSREAPPSQQKEANSRLEKKSQKLLQHDYRLSLRNKEGRAFFRLQGG